MDCLSSPRPIDCAACCSCRTGVTIRVAARYPSVASNPTAIPPNTVIQVNRCLMGPNSSSDDCQTNVCHVPTSGEPLVRRLVSGSGENPMMEEERPPWPSLGALVHPGERGVTSGIRLVSERLTPVGRIGQLM